MNSVIDNLYYKQGDDWCVFSSTTFHGTQMEDKSRRNIHIKCTKLSRGTSNEPDLDVLLCTCKAAKSGHTMKQLSIVISKKPLLCFLHITIPLIKLQEVI